jgi:hypothetical protein
MMTPQTTVVPFEFYICDLSGAYLADLGERFIICDEAETPLAESLLENADILLEARGIVMLEDNVMIHAKNYLVYTVMFNMQRCYAAARIPAWRRSQGAVPPGAGSG